MISDRYDHELVKNIIMREHANQYAGGKALIILGGPSAKNWKSLFNEIKPDVILGANGTNAVVPNLDYWMLMENMLRTYHDACKGTARAKEFIRMVQQTGPRVRLVNKKTYQIIRDKENVIPVQRCGALEPDQIFSSGFSLRDYGNGYWKGALMRRPEILGKLKLAVGTVGLQLLHHAGILGVSEIHTIGYDLCFKGDGHHWYQYPAYMANYYWGDNMFTEYKGVKTLWFWVDSACYLRQIESIFAREGILWRDHSDGLLRVEGLQCAT